ncbi:hypothetical protein KKD62_03260 [Patescibacteria group bacterium]|nr:hypothetical protein [Patescibacteria group bacterium]MBU1931519.1 hypothetical protein [Patescibacteria group bacterium]
MNKEIDGCSGLYIQDGCEGEIAVTLVDKAGAIPPDVAWIVKSGEGWYVIEFGERVWGWVRTLEEGDSWITAEIVRANPNSVPPFLIAQRFIPTYPDRYNLVMTNKAGEGLDFEMRYVGRALKQLTLW